MMHMPAVPALPDESAHWSKRLEAAWNNQDAFRFFCVFKIYYVN